MIKVCGMKDPQNMKELQELRFDLMGMIFYSKSPRSILNSNPKEIPIKKYGINRVGVFVNEDVNFIKEMIQNYALDLIQLHGNESYGDCLLLNELVPVVKAFSIKEQSDIEKVNCFGEFEGYYLFDTKTPNHGGSGQKFDWSLLDTYKGEMPFFLSGGISKDDADLIKSIKHPKFIGVDLNSKFEVEPGVKDIKELEKFINNIRS